MSARIPSHMQRRVVLWCPISGSAILCHVVRVALRPLFDHIHGRALSAAEDDLRHVPAPAEDVSDIQDVEESATDTATSGHGSPQIQIWLRAEGPEEYDRYQKHLAARHEGRRADCEVQHRDGLCTVEDTVGSDADEYWCLCQSNAYDPLKGNQFGAGLGPFEVVCYTLGECYDARDTDGRGDGFNDSDREGGLA